MTENPRPAGGSTENPADAERDAWQALGLEITEESPTIRPDSTESSIIVATPTTAVDVPGTDLVALPPAASTELIATSRRARRDAERATPAVRRPRRDVFIARRSAPRGARRASSPAGPVESLSPTTSVVTSRPSAASAGPRVSLSRRVAKKVFPPIVMLAAASLLVGTSVPANALFDPASPPASLALSSMPVEPVEAAEAVALKEQVIEAEVPEELAATAASRDEWGVTSYAEMLRLRYGSANYSYSTTGAGMIRWPFPFSAPIVSAFGDRAAPCRGCSSYHRGLDFNAGYGAPIGAIADGVVSYVGYGGGWGYRVEIEHIINGQKVTSLYAHMISDSSALQVGSPVVAGDMVGALGNTGLSTGPHLHLEVHIDSVPVDPFAWLTANAS